MYSKQKYKSLRMPGDFSLNLSVNLVIHKIFGQGDANTHTHARIQRSTSMQKIYDFV